MIPNLGSGPIFGIQAHFHVLLRHPVRLSRHTTCVVNGLRPSLVDGHSSLDFVYSIRVRRPAPSLERMVAGQHFTAVATFFFPTIALRLATRVNNRLTMNSGICNLYFIVGYIFLLILDNVRLLTANIRVY